MQCLLHRSSALAIGVQMHALAFFSANLKETFPDAPVSICPHVIPQTKGESALDAKHKAIGDNTRLVFHQV
jgi:hypothetical protein